jgi:hypothetical protein
MTDRIGMMIVAVATNTTTITYVYNGTTYYSYFNTPLITLHNNLAGLQGGSADEYYHLTKAIYIIANQAANDTNAGYLSSVDWVAFNNKANISDLNAYTLRTDTNTWASQLDRQMQVDSNQWTLTKVDANILYPLKSDVNTWAGQLDAPLLSKVDANGFYPLKADVNTWAGQLDKQMQSDSNQWSLTKLDANILYPLKSDVNTWAGQLDAAYLSKVDANILFAFKTDVNLWGDQRYMPLGSGMTDTNWQTSFGIFDSNMRSTYATRADVNLWGGQLYILKSAFTGANQILVTDVNGIPTNFSLTFGIGLNNNKIATLGYNSETYIAKSILSSPNQLLGTTVLGVLTPYDIAKAGVGNDTSIPTVGYVDANFATKALYLTKVDANGFYPLKADVNVWIDQKLTPYLTQVDANGFYTLKADTNIWIDQKLLPYLSQVDANGFYPLKSDVNTWGDQRYLKLTGGNINGSVVVTDDVNAKNLHADTNITIGANGYIYDDGNVLIIGRR